MSEPQSNAGREIVPAAKNEISLRSTTLVSRGLADLARLDKLVNTGRASLTAVAKNQPAISEVTNSLGMRLAYIPAGEFLMGSPAGEEGHFFMGSPAGEEGHIAHERQHRVRITKPFYMGVYTVTQSEYERIMGSNPSRFKGINLPVEQVSWDDAQEFCRKLSQKEGKTYRLPTEAEWEYACRAGTSTPFNFGSTLNGTEANCDGNDPYGTTTKGAYLYKTATVGSYRPNAFGLYDMHGNVFEWCSDWYDYYANSPADNPKGPDAGSGRVFRGGCWLFDAVGCRSAYRDGSEPACRDSYVGFRVLREQ